MKNSLIERYLEKERNDKRKMQETSYPDIETEINIEFDKMWKEARDVKGLRGFREIFNEYQDKIEELMEKLYDQYEDMEISWESFERIRNLIDEYLEGNPVRMWDDLRTDLEEKTRGWASQTLDYYASEDFEGTYLDVLVEIMYTDGRRELDKIVEEINYGAPREDQVFLTDEDEDKIFDYVVDNLDDHVERFSNYGGDPVASIASVSFGEQEEQLEEGLDVDVLEDEGFYYDDGFVYYDLTSEGLQMLVYPEDIEEILGN